MKKLIIISLSIIIVVLVIVTRYGQSSAPKAVIQTNPYKYVENLNGIGCLKIGMTRSEIKKAIDSTYFSYHKHLKKRYAKLFELVKPFSDETPLDYYPKYRAYTTDLMLAEDFTVHDIELYFWSDTLYRIRLHDARGDTKQVGDGLVIKYGDGLGHNENEGYYEDQLHKWGNDKCITTYIGKTVRSSDGPRFFYDVEVITKDSDLPAKVKAYLHSADSLWKIKRNAEKYKNL